MKGKQLHKIVRKDRQNDLYPWGEPRTGGACTRYLIQQADTNGGVVIVMQDGPGNATGAVGASDADLLEIVRDRLRCFQAGEYKCREFACALTHIEEALMWLNHRMETAE